MGDRLILSPKSEEITQRERKRQTYAKSKISGEIAFSNAQARPRGRVRGRKFKGQKNL
jgi:hypothetical protein